jgi:ribose 5-phosphate isomerase A
VAFVGGKRGAGEAAAGLVEDGMDVGLGTGSTAREFIIALAARTRAGLRIRAVATSHASAALAREHGIDVGELDGGGLDLTVDGADAVDPDLRLIKGFGGAHVREKVVAAASRRFVIVVDASKLVDRLGGRVPVEVLDFGAEATLAALRRFGVPFTVRDGPDGGAVRSDNGNPLADGLFGPIDHPEELAAALDAVPGVVGHGLFLGMADQVLIGEDGGVRELVAGGSSRRPA